MNNPAIESTETGPAAFQVPPSTDQIVEVRILGSDELITLEQTEREIAELGPDWRLPTPNEEHRNVDYGHKNQHGALSRDETRKPDRYWTNQPHPADPSARVVVWFDDGYVLNVFDYHRARARAVRVAGQSSDI